MSVDVCLIGDFQSDDHGYNGPPSKAQIDSLVEWLVYVHKQIPSITRTCGHGDLMDDACPGDVVKLMLPSIKSRVFAELHGQS